MNSVTEILPAIPASKRVVNETTKYSEARLAAEKLEATFLAEMLKAAGFGEQENSFSGGAGEDQFVSFHRHAIADKIAASGGLGLAEHITRALLEANNDA